MTTAVLSEQAVRQALQEVLDPELDQPITELGFVARLQVSGTGEVAVDLRLPTYFCAPNFAYLMAADAREAVSAVPGVRQVRVRLLNHFASEEINAGVAADSGFRAAFPGLADGELEQLRRTFLRKAHLACQEQLAGKLLRSGVEPAQLVRVRLGELGTDPLVERLRKRRQKLGLPCDDDALLLLDEHGAPVAEEELPLRLRRGRATRVSIESNREWCQGLLATRYGGTPGDERATDR